MGVALAPAAARADEREGAFLGAGIGIGAMRFEEAGQELAADDSMAMRILLGGMISPRLALLVELDEMRGEAPYDNQDGRFEVRQRSLTSGIRFWPWRRLWLQATVGRVWATAHDPFLPGLVPDVWGDDAVDGTTLATGFGLEVLRDDAWSVDIALRGGGTEYRGSALSGGQASVGFAFHWFQ
ncbi:MAG TPA: hypothetical protein VMZ28_18755 [Kofleriaceae bacterium]|nr:hypothetical protein [Kofleriaceae bacterium]